MRIAPASDYRDDVIDSDLRAFLDRPLHPVELENGKGQSDLRSGTCCTCSQGRVPLIAQRKLNPVLGDRSDRSPANLRSGRDVELLPDFSPQDASKVSRVFSE